MAKRKRHSSREATTATQFWPVAYIKDEDKANGRFLVVWEGPYDPTWEPREFVNQPAIDEWERRKTARTMNNLHSSTKTFHAPETAHTHKPAPVVSQSREAPAVPTMMNNTHYAVQHPPYMAPIPPRAESVATTASESQPVSPGRMDHDHFARRVSFTESQASTDGAPPVKRPVIRRPPPQRGHTPVRIIKAVGWR